MFLWIVLGLLGLLALVMVIAWGYFWVYTPSESEADLNPFQKGESLPLSAALVSIPGETIIRTIGMAMGSSTSPKSEDSDSVST